MSKTFVIYGVSKGLGQALLQTIPQRQDQVFGVSRSKPESYLPNFHWICADLAHPGQARDAVKHQIQHQTVDYLIYNVGIWEEKAFDTDYAFEQCSDLEISNLVQTNIQSCILAIQSLLENLRLSANAKIILIGSTWGLDNHSGKEVVFSATKFALRGIVHALRETLRKDQIGISILNLGYLATEFDISTSIDEVILQSDAQLIPLQDVVLAIQFILSTSKASCVKEIDMPAMADLNL
ncbi:SDR family NAD(P)-dependent oxidoreductase [Acinetobacter bereziniae]|uniref:SDR family NAD(P)-dependent oxidoreductase n=1 Tax=Acinetobacter bereziniae TaxID=106648 RepID=UPI001580D21E|nr:SDR family oxidoreductase [Acinetobacter bereziniae]NUF61481.1 SDR family oxidoreductase [Acinetobacter bereziniae]NUG06535.1 SDR family oxidoreductase [Acinetobacter bereziniae]NUG63321.1 SDR family oxidoreductase [Acinetobacter bereziniae]NUG69292.1 SDR family oxidoreductase [Acinetobacter bereziniae]NUG80430.1 SDR family oxidoreductase [Acinetobacter bereziniae]